MILVDTFPARMILADTFPARMILIDTFPARMILYLEPSDTQDTPGFALGPYRTSSRPPDPSPTFSVHPGCKPKNSITISKWSYN